VEPDAVDHALREEGVVAARQPRREPGAAVGDLLVLEHRTPERLGLHHLPGPRLADLAVGDGVDDLLAREAPLLQLDPREEGGEAVVIVLRPALEDVVVALGALDPDPEEELRGRLDRVLGSRLIR
jgi:hypothetical protein